MDVHCSTCGEPWETFHLLEELIYEACGEEQLTEIWLGIPVSERLSSSFRPMFQVLGWEFGDSILDVCHCACCPGDLHPNESLALTRSAIVEILGADTDAIAATFEEFGL